MGFIRNVKDWFQQTGDDLFSIDKKVEELKENQMLPNKVNDILVKLEEENKDSETDYKNAKKIYEDAAEKRTHHFNIWDNKKKEFKLFKQEHHGFIGKILYNLPPFRFFSIGKQYQRLRKEIEISNKEYKFWIKCSDEKNHIFEQADEYRKEKRRALAEYKRIIAKKAKMYKNEFKLISEYNKMNKTQMNHIEEEFGSDIKRSLESHMNLVIDKWFDLNKISTNFDIKTVTKAIIKMRKGQELNENDKLAVQSIVNNNNSQQKDKDKNKTKKDLKQDIEPPVNYQKYKLDRRAIEVLSYKYNEKSNTNLTPEEFLIVIGLSYKTNLDMKDILNRVDKIKGYNNTGSKTLGKLAAQGAEIFSKMLNDDTIGNGYEEYVELYKKAKDTIDRNTPTKADGQRTN